MAGASTGTRHYAARTVTHPDLFAGALGPIWRDTMEGRYRTDPDALAAVLPPPLEPTEDADVRLSIATGTNPDGTTFGEGRISVQARHGTIVGDYPLLVVYTGEHDAIDARERFGEPAHVGKINGSIKVRRVEKRITRLDHHVAHLVGVVEGPQPPASTSRTEFTFRVSRAIDGARAIEGDAELLVVTRTIEERKAAKVGGIVRLGASPFDPIRELPLRQTHGVRIAQQFITVSARSAGRIPADDIVPFLHHRYDPPPVADDGD